MALAQTLVDAFSDNSFNDTLWSRTNSTQITESGGSLNLATILAGNYVEVSSDSTYDLTGSYFFVKITDVGNTAIESYEVYPLTAFKDASNYVEWTILGGQLQPYKYVSSSGTYLGSAVAYNATNHKYLRIRESSGTIYFDYSADGSSWSNFTTLANPFAITAMKATMSVGTWQAEASTTTLKLNNFNSTASSASSSASPSVSPSSSPSQSPSSSKSPSQSPSNSPSSSKSPSQSPSLSPSSSVSPSAATTTIQAWLYPGVPACNADEEYSDGRVIDVLKPEYLHLEDDGTISQVLVADGCNGYSAANALDIIAHSTYQYVTVSGATTGLQALLASGTKMDNAITAIVDMIGTCNFDGAELDWEGYSGWSAANWTAYKAFLVDLGDALHAEGYKLIVLGPPITNSTEQSYYVFKYEDLNSISQIDYVNMMLYDYQYDYGGGASISPNTWVQNGCDWVKAKITDIDRIIVGMPSYGYHATVSGYDVVIDTKAQSAGYTGYGTATRNADHEMNWTNSGVYYAYMDTAGMNSKKGIIEAKGIRNISVWHLGGNDWFTEEASSSNSPSTSPSASRSPSPSPSSSRSPSVSPSSSNSPSESPSLSPSASRSPSPSPSNSPSNSPSQSPSVSPSVAPDLVYKEILYKVFQSDGTFVTTWTDVVSELTFKWTINGGLSNITIRLARPESSFGENEDVKQGNIINVYIFDEESGVDGILVYSGILVSYVPQVIGGREYVDVEFFSHYWELKNKILESGGNTEVAYSSQDPGAIMRSVLDLYAGTIDHTTGSVDDTSTTVSYTFNTVDYQSAVSKILELCPDGWFYRVGADSILYMEAREVNASHYFTMGREIMEYYPEKRSEGIVNTVYFRGGSTLYKKYTSTSSVSTYGTRAVTVIDERVTVEATADIIADRILDAKASPEIRVVLKIMDSNGQDNEKGYDIESIKPGQTCKILNATSKSENLWDISLWDGASWDYDITNASATQLQIMSVEYHLDYAVIELSNRQPDIAKRIEDINRNVMDAITIDNPSAPTT